MEPLRGAGPLSPRALSPGREDGFLLGRGPALWQLMASAAGTERGPCSLSGRVAPGCVPLPAGRHLGVACGFLNVDLCLACPSVPRKDTSVWAACHYQTQ